jgi:ABC-type dipeptide/oligopeptide/nickel transport system ATPase component
MSDDFPITWKQGEHVAVVGDTGTGKTYLIAKLIETQPFAVVFRTKPDDIRFEGFRKSRNGDAVDDIRLDRILLEPKYEHQAYHGWELLEKTWKHGGWCVVIDELWYAEKIGLKVPIERMLTQGRSKGITGVVGMQRPAQVSRFALSQCTHLFVFRVEGRDLMTIKESTTPRIVGPIDAISGHDFVYYNRAKRIIASGNARRLSDLIVRNNPRQTS